MKNKIIIIFIIILTILMIPLLYSYFFKPSCNLLLFDELKELYITIGTLIGGIAGAIVLFFIYQTLKVQQEMFNKQLFALELNYKDDINKFCEIKFKNILYLFNRVVHENDHELYFHPEYNSQLYNKLDDFYNELKDKFQKRCPTLCFDKMSELINLCNKRLLNELDNSIKRYDVILTDNKVKEAKKGVLAISFTLFKKN